MCDNQIYRILNIFKYLIYYTFENNKRKDKNWMTFKKTMKCLNELFGNDSELYFEF